MATADDAARLEVEMDDESIAAAARHPFRPLDVVSDLPAVPTITLAELDVLERYFADLIDAALTADT